MAFVAAHVLAPRVDSGGDVLFANVAREAARLRPDWRIAVIAPDYACDGLAPFFRCVRALPSGAGEQQRVARNHRAVASAWARRARLCVEATLSLRPRLVHATGDFLVDVFPAAQAAKRTGCRFTGVVHHLNAPPLRRRSGLLTATVSWLLQHASLRALRFHADRVLLLNDEVRRGLLGRGFRDTQLTVTGGGIDLARFRPAPPPPSRDRVLWVHRLEPTKGISDLPRLAAHLGPTVRIDVVGRGPAAFVRRLERDLARCGVADRVAVHGYVDDAALVELYARANAFVSCSYEEGWGLSLAEALAAGVPCVAYALPSHAEAFGDAVETVPVGDVAALARRVLEVMRRDEGEAARRRRREAVEPYSFESAAIRQVAVFEALLGACSLER